MINNLLKIIKKKLNNLSNSYSKKIFFKETNFLIKKIFEELFELFQTYEKYKIYKNCYFRHNLIKELIDVLYHLIIFIAINKIYIKEINKEFYRRKILSGIEEKISR